MSKRNQSERGFSLMMTALCMVVMLGMLGLSIDLSRMYITKNELQAFVDSAVMAAALELDGTTAGIARARNIALYGPGAASGTWGPNPNRYNFGTQVIPTSGIEVGFSQTGTGGWDPNPSPAAGYKYIRIRATTQMPVYLLRIFQGVASAYNVPAAAASGQLSVPLGKSGDPFSPDAINPSDPDYGYTRGAWYTLRWAPPGRRCEVEGSGNGNGNGNGGGGCPNINNPVNPPNSWSLADGMCPGEIAAAYNPGNGSDRGYIDLGQGNGNSALTAAIVDHDYDTEYPPLNIGDQIDVVTGQKHVGPSMVERYNQDSDLSSTTYAQYKTARTGNGRRILRVPVNDPGSGRIIGFATFFMPVGSGCSPDSNSGICCAEFVTNKVLLGPFGDAADNGTGQTQTVFGVKLMNGGF